VRVATEVERSRFITTLVPVTDVDDAMAVLADIRVEFPDASHHGSAFVLGTDGAQTRANDDGEPGGTAGAPMLAVLRGAGVTDVLAVVTRYFGGTKLGAGGLVRAYGGAVTAALDGADRLARVPVARFEVAADHDRAGQLEHRLRRWAEDLDAAVGVAVYDAAGARLEVQVPLGVGVDRLHARLAEVGIEHRLTRRGTAVRSIRRAVNG
jgi:uncharacterized YigZ family protein